MLRINKKLLTGLSLVAIIIAALFYFRYQVYYSHSIWGGEKTFEIEKGQGNGEVAQNLFKEGLISGKIYFYYYMRSSGMLNKILPGVYVFRENMTIPEIAAVITTKKEEFTKVTFPEGFSSAKMADRLGSNGFDGKGFLELVKKPDQFRTRYDFLADPKIKTLEGFLFPDTYFLKPDDTPEKIINRILDNFSRKYTDELASQVASSGHSLLEEMTMASVIEMEVKSPTDRRTVSGIFWRRIAAGQPLQSCASIAYILGVNKKQYSFEDTRIASPYNTYINKNLPPGPIANPGFDSIEAALNPAQNEYMYFLSDPETGETIFAKTIEEHNANKASCGL